MAIIIIARIYTLHLGNCYIKLSISGIFQYLTHSNWSY